ncbi:glycoside hydrolase family 3 C-terminal domain-containing protein [Streptomyces sp. NPDC019937]|uniref:glycoside hydrolase family 3 C-terminal domain-containing protein n=1 Tax=Streptomyces sp. NPDC019937 TaxID=3154787 RepID=UPI0033F7DA91
MTLEEKLSFVHWSYHTSDESAKVYLPGVPRLGIPEMRATDGPAGITIHRPSLALPAPVALASTFDDGLARSYGAVMGREGRAFGQDVVFAPMVNSIRVPYAGRNFETFSEDPLVTSRMAAAEIKGIQSQGLIAATKHYAANNQEKNRFSVNVNVDEQTLRERELPGFESAVAAGTGSMMCAYNKVNGQPACGSDELLNKVLKEQWKFRGWVTSDWLATQSTDALTKGLDQELGIELDHEPAPGEPIPGGKFFGDALKAAIRAGQIPESALDEAVTRIVSQMARFRLLDEDPPARPARDLAGGLKVARQVAEDGAVLLRNEGAALPLTTETAADIAVIGPTAKVPKVTGLGSSYIVPDAASAPLDTIRERAGAGSTVRYSTGEETVGVPVPQSALSAPRPSGEVFPAGEGGVLYDGTITVPATGNYRIAARAQGGNAYVELDGQEPFGAGLVYGDVSSRPMRLTAGTHKLRITGAALAKSPMTFELTWVTPQAAQEAIDRAVSIARTARTAVVFAYDDGSEDGDRTSLSLPGRQDDLISAVAAVNPRTVVVLNTGSSLTMPWLRKTAAVLTMWYPGQAGAEATTALLFGDADPGGRLTQTFPADERQTPFAGNPRRYPGVDDQLDYSEGIYSGYRWYEQQGAQPLFSFGYGLSYTSFDYRDLKVTAAADGGLDVSFTLRNTGTRTGKEVPQVYVGPSPHVRVAQAKRALAAYGKVELRPGESRRLALRVERRALQNWDSGAHAWVTGPGRQVMVGPSLGRLPLRATAP